jgi:hypothetical protein
VSFWLFPEHDRGCAAFVPMMVGMMVMLAVVVMSRAEAHVMLVSHVEGPLYPTRAIDVKQFHEELRWRDGLHPFN